MKKLIYMISLLTILVSCTDLEPRVYSNITMEQLMADVEARISAMTPEEKRALLDREEQRHR